LWLCFILSLHSIICFSARHYLALYPCYLSLSGRRLSPSAILAWWMTQTVTCLCIPRMHAYPLRLQLRT
jgi:hypothetical protein